MARYSKLFENPVAFYSIYVLVFFLQTTRDNEQDMEEENPKWSTSKVAPYVVKLPLPPDYYLKELRELLANYANELEQDENSFDDET